VSVERKVLGRRGQHLVALPAAVRKHLRSVPGGTVYWRITRKDEAVLARKDRSARGPTRDQVPCASCAALEREITLLRARAEGRDLGLFGQGYAAGYRGALDYIERPSSPSQMDARLNLAKWRASRSTSARQKDARQHRRREYAVPSPSPSSPGVPGDGGAETSGAEPPGLPLSAE